jgi:hypothetical protein
MDQIKQQIFSSNVTTSNLLSSSSSERLTTANMQSFEYLNNHGGSITKFLQDNMGASPDRFGENGCNVENYLKSSKIGL